MGTLVALAGPVKRYVPVLGCTRVYSGVTRDPLRGTHLVPCKRRPRTTQGSARVLYGNSTRLCACACISVRACVCARVCVCVGVRACVRACVPQRCAGTLVARRGRAVFIAQLRRADGPGCVFAFGVIVRSPALAAGATWTLVIASAPWAARGGHTSVVDAAGAIYVIGGGGFTDTRYDDVWISTDGGPDRARAGYSGGTGWVLLGYYRGTQVLEGVRSGHGWCSKGT
jgi:hypothetical protein